MRIEAPAKVNLALDIVRKREDGYHDLDMVMAPIDLYDVLEIEPSDKDVILCSVPLPEENTISKALKLLQDRYGAGHYRIQVEKHIPEQAGLAGGSADGAAVIRAVNELEGLGLSVDELLALGQEVGADVPFCLVNRTSRVQGTGEIVCPLENQPELEFLLVKPDFGISTPASFARWDASCHVLHDVDLVQTALEHNDPELLYSTMANGLEPVALELEPRLGDVFEKMSEAGLVRVMMTGSGSALMGFSVDHDVLEKACAALSRLYPFVRICKVVQGQ